MRRVVVLVAGTAVAAAVVVVVLVLRSDNGAQRRVGVGMRAPAFAETAVRGGTVSLARLRGHVVLVSFLDIRADTSANEPSRAQIVFLRSMHTQHMRFGLRVVVVDTAKQTHDELVNDTYDWSLDPAIAVLGDSGTLARRFGVQRTPTTFVIGRDGVVRSRWDGFAAAAQLDFALRKLEGRGPAG